MSETVKVIVRVRPMNKLEKEKSKSIVNFRLEGDRTAGRTGKPSGAS